MLFIWNWCGLTMVSGNHHPPTCLLNWDSVMGYNISTVYLSPYFNLSYRMNLPLGRISQKTHELWEKWLYESHKIHYRFFSDNIWHEISLIIKTWIYSIFLLFFFMPYPIGLYCTETRHWTFICNEICKQGGMRRTGRT